MKKWNYWLPTVALVAWMNGCTSYDVLQSNIFSDETGKVFQVDYGRSTSEHKSTFKAPATGKEMEFKSRLLVKVHLPDGDSFKAWQCMNFTGAGTTYKTDDGEWMFIANGFTAFVYKLEEENNRYREVYRGVLCETPDSEYKPNSKWRELKKNDRGEWK